MSTKLEALPTESIDVPERLTHDDERSAIRERLDERFVVTDLSQDQRERVIDEAMNSIDGFLKLDPLELGHGILERQRVIDRLSEVTDSPVDEDGRYSTKHLQAMKYFLGTLFERIRAEEIDNKNSEEAERVAGIVHAMYLSGSPNIASYAGSLAGQLELLSYANRSEAGRTVSYGVATDIIYWASRGPSSETFAKVIAEAPSSMAQIGTINTLTRLVHLSSQQGSWARPFADEVSIGLHAVAGGQGKCTPFVRLVAYSKSAESLEGEGEIVLVEEDKVQNHIPLGGLSEQKVELIRELYNPNLRALIEQELSIDISQLTPDAQLQLVTFMSEVDSYPQYERFKRVLKESGLSRHELAETFLATEFGDDYGEAILAIAESKAITSEVAAEILEKMVQMRGNIHIFTDKIAAIAGEDFARNARERFTHRVTDILYGIKYYVENGEKTEMIQMGSMKVPVSINEEKIRRRIRWIDSVFSELASITISEKSNSSNDEVTPLEFGYVAGTDDSVLLMTKPYKQKSHSDMVRGSKPRANFMFGVDGQSPSLNMAERDEQVISVRLDLDDDGMLRLDIGGKPLDYKEDDVPTDKSDTPDFAVAKLVSLGNWYRSQQVGSESSDYHVDLQLMSPEDFAKAIQDIRNGIEYSPTSLRTVRKQGEMALLSALGGLDRAA